MISTSVVNVIKNICNYVYARFDLPSLFKDRIVLHKSVGQSVEIILAVTNRILLTLLYRNNQRRRKVEIKDCVLPNTTLRCGEVRRKIDSYPTETFLYIILSNSVDRKEKQ